MNIIQEIDHLHFFGIYSMLLEQSCIYCFFKEWQHILKLDLFYQFFRNDEQVTAYDNQKSPGDKTINQNFDKFVCGENNSHFNNEF